MLKAPGVNFINTKFRHFKRQSRLLTFRDCEFKEITPIKSEKKLNKKLINLWKKLISEKVNFQKS